MLVRRDDEALLGGITLTNLRRGVAQCASLGYWIGARHARQGYMTEGIGGMLTFCFEDLGLHRVEAACLPTNVASKALLTRRGFREEGYAREYLRINGKWQDHLLFAMLRDEWAMTKGR
jgi:ribosomal-protein-alanine N-acetyltransferase